MKFLIGLVVLLVLALAAGPRSQKRLPVSRFFLIGGEFLLLGWALGEQGLGLLDAGTLKALEPLIVLGLGWIGLLVGLQGEGQLLRRVPGMFWAVGLAQGLLVLVVLFLVFYPLFLKLFGPSQTTLAAAFFLAVAGADSSQHVLALALRERKRHPHAPVHLFQVSAEIDTLIPLLALALLAGFHHELALAAPGGLNLLAALRWTGFGVALGAILGLLLAFLLHRVSRSVNHTLITVGFLVFSGGLCRSLDFPPLFVNFVAGLVTVNVLGHRAHTWELAVASERPFYFIFLILVGAGWQLGSPWALLLALLFFVLRLLAKVWAFNSSARIVFGKQLMQAKSGLALSGQSGLSVALVASSFFLERGIIADSAYTIVLASFLLSSVFAPSLTLSALERGGKS